MILSPDSENAARTLLLERGRAIGMSLGQRVELAQTSSADAEGRDRPHPGGVPWPRQVVGV